MTGAWRGLVTDRRGVIAIAVYLAGLGLGAAVAFPDPSHPLTGFERLGASSIAASVGRAIAQPVGHAGMFAIVPRPSLFVWGYFLYLLPNVPVLAFAAGSLVGIETLFNVVYGPGAPWHIGNLMLVLVAAMWLDASGSAPALALPPALVRTRVWLGRLLCVPMAVTLAGQISLGADHLRADLQYDYSANKRFAELLHSDPALATAVITGEPDTPLWSVSYYADNRIYLPRERVFRAWGMSGQHRPGSFSLGDLLETARRLKEECGCPVVITMGWPLAQPGTLTNFRGTRFEETFVVTPEARAEFFAATQLLARLGPTITDENYDVYLLR